MLARRSRPAVRPGARHHADHTTFRCITPILASRFTVYAMDRRGRGASEDSSEYAMEREVEDVVAVVAALGQDVALFGHSFGADLALQASARTSNLSPLVLYEPGGGGDGDPTNVQAGSRP
ncbi:MAG: alpha/beta fold hydrolase [Actinomycetota bacterium]